MKVLFKKIFFVFALLSFFWVSTSWSRAGGAGGGSRGGGGGGGFSHSGGYSSGGGGVVYYGGGSSSSDNGSFFILFTIIFIIYVVYMLNQRRGGENSPVEHSSPEGLPVDPAMRSKVQTAFLTIQQSWSQKRLDLMRRFVTDGVYQRFNAQFTMMNKLSQTDVMKSVTVQNISLDLQTTDGLYDVMTFRILAYAEDQFVSERYPVLNSPGGGEDFVEFWSFIRRKDYKKGFDLFHSEVCPQCAAPLKAQLVETARCPYCGTYLNNGEYDWVLAEITQEDDYNPVSNFHIPTDIAARLPDFSKQLIEDRASNAFTQILIACATHDEAPLMRFSSAQALAGLKDMMGLVDFLFDRLFLNSVEVVSCRLNGNTCRVQVDIHYSYRRVQIQNDQAFILDNDVVTDTKSITLIREIGQGVKPMGSIYANSCSHCGAAQKDSLSSVCAYCNQPLNDPKTEWVVDQFE